MCTLGTNVIIGLYEKHFITTYVVPLLVTYYFSFRRDAYTQLVTYKGPAKKICKSDNIRMYFKSLYIMLDALYRVKSTPLCCLKPAI